MPPLSSLGNLPFQAVGRISMTWMEIRLTVRNIWGLQYIGAGLQYIGAPKFYFQYSGEE